MSYIPKIVHLKELTIGFYQKHSNILIPVLKGVFSFITLMVLKGMFPYGSKLNVWALFIGVSVIQAFLPVVVLFFTGFTLILTNTWNVSLDIFAVFLILMLIILLACIRIDGKYTVILMLTPILFACKMEYFLPVLLGITIGYGAVIPCVSGVLLYFFSQYTIEASTLITTSSNSEIGVGLQRMIDMVSIDKYLIVVLVTFTLIIILSSCVYHLLDEKAWMIAIVVGHIMLAFVMLAGQYVFELDLSVIRIFLEVIFSMGISLVIQLFRGIGDVSRIEKVRFEDDEYVYYVKAVPKIRMTHEEVNKKIIN